MALITSGLVADWQFAEGSGNTSADSSGNGHTLTGFGAPGQPVWTARGIEVVTPGQSLQTDVPGASVLTLQILGKYKGADAKAAICGLYPGESNPITWGWGQFTAFGRNVPRVDNDQSGTIVNNMAVYLTNTISGDPSQNVFLSNTSFEISYTHPGAGGDIYFRGATQCFGRGSDTSATGRGANFYIGYSFAGDGSGFNKSYLGEIYRIVVYNRALSPAEVASNSAYYASWASGRGITLNEQNPSTKPVLLGDGDSIMQCLGNGVATPWLTEVAPLMPLGGATSYNAGVGGQNVQSMLGISRQRWETLYAPGAPYNFCAIHAGTNDEINGRTPGQAAGDLLTLAQEYATQGWIGCVDPILDKGAAGGGDPDWIAAANSLLAAATWPPGWKFTGTASYPHLVPPGSYASTVYFATNLDGSHDSTHPSQVGTNELARGMLLGYYGSASSPASSYTFAA